MVMRRNLGGNVVPRRGLLPGFPMMSHKAPAAQVVQRKPIRAALPHEQNPLIHPVVKEFIAKGGKVGNVVGLSDKGGFSNLKLSPGQRVGNVVRLALNGEGILVPSKKVGPGVKKYPLGVTIYNKAGERVGIRLAKRV